MTEKLERHEWTIEGHNGAKIFHREARTLLEGEAVERLQALMKKHILPEQLSGARPDGIDILQVDVIERKPLTIRVGKSPMYVATRSEPVD